MMKFGNRPLVEQGRSAPLEGHFRVLFVCVLATICPQSNGDRGTDVSGTRTLRRQ